MGLSKEEVTKKLEKFPEWSFDEELEKVVTGFEFENFAEAVEFSNGIAQVAEDLGHHPDIFVHDYKFVSVFLSTHEEGITEKDFEFIEKLEASMDKEE
ncbi:MAG: 4a-hydroxytetrahydrobiopterin dehydratase [Candidatus Dojkabacteria bacterium]